MAKILFKAQGDSLKTGWFLENVYKAFMFFTHLKFWGYIFKMGV